MSGNNFVKSILVVFLALALTVTCTACGGSSGEASAENKAAPAVEYWVCTGLDMGDGEMMDTEAIQALMGIDGSEVMALCIDDGKAELYLMGDILSCDWTETQTGGRLTSPEYDGVVAEFTAEAEGTLKCVLDDEDAGMIFLLSRVDTRPEIFDRPVQAEGEMVSLPGFWVCTGLDMGDGEVMDAEAIQALFQTGADSIISLRLREDGTAYVLYFGECISGIWEETDTGFDIRIGGEEGETLSFYDWGDGTVDLTVEDENAAFDFTLSKSETVPQAFENAPLALLDVRFTPEQTIDMSNFMLLGRYAILDGKLYGYYSESPSDRRLISYDYDPTQPKDSRLTGFTQMDEGGTPCYLQTANGYLYYVCQSDNGNTLRRIGMDGSGKTVLADVFLDDFAEDDWYAGFGDYLEKSESMLKSARAGFPLDVDSNPLIRLAGLMISIGLGCLLSMLICALLWERMKSVAVSTEANAYLRRDSVVITKQEDQFTHRTQTRVKIEKSSGSKGGGTTVDSDGFSGKSGKF